MTYEQAKAIYEAAEIATDLAHAKGSMQAFARFESVKDLMIEMFPEISGSPFSDEFNQITQGQA